MKNFDGEISPSRRENAAGNAELLEKEDKPKPEETIVNNFKPTEGKSIQQPIKNGTTPHTEGSLKTADSDGSSKKEVSQ